jgi:phage I-like protein
VASAVPFGETFLVGTEADGAVRRLKALDGKPEDQAAWTMATPGRIVKRIAATKDLVAVAYWGGTLKVLDAEGKVKCMAAMPQDITALVWAEGKLVAGLADGSVVALSTK